MAVNCTLDNAVEVLNRIHTADKTVLSELIDKRVPCNHLLADDPTVQIGYVNDDPESGQFEVGLLGILNGLFPLDNMGRGYIEAVYDFPEGRRRLVRFQKSYD